VHTFFSLAVDAVSVQLHASGSLPYGRKPGAHWLGGWVGPLTVLNILEEREIRASAVI